MLSIVDPAATAGQAFGQGSDSRLAGHPVSDNPYPYDMAAARENWDRGWRSVDTTWGKDAKWPVKSLRSVMGRA